VIVTAGQVHDSTQFEAVMDSVAIQGKVGRPRTRPECLAGDKGYSYPRIRRWLRSKRIKAVVPQRKDQRRQHRGRPLGFDKKAYKRRNIVERVIGWLKECRRIATRFEKLATTFTSMLTIGIIVLYLRGRT
jgi:transposase